MSDRSATAAMALGRVARGVPRLAGFGAWRPGISGIPYLGGDEPYAVAMVLIHDPRNPRVRSTTLVATPHRAAEAPTDDEQCPR
ncbi:hypothetical protein ABZ942_21940 [Nocardia sp. NPDC046473]|uniref:hypothetical protein n=1 Tax=Nocardia sp. NPDC046473 TaxID=3155733 RepID=UPI0033FC3C67